VQEARFGQPRTGAVPGKGLGIHEAWLRHRKGHGPGRPVR
jgi:hypothetical protein